MVVVLLIGSMVDLTEVVGGAGEEDVCIFLIDSPLDCVVL